MSKSPKVLHIEREREWERARLALDLLAERKHFLTLKPDEYRLLGGDIAEEKAGAPLDSQLRFAALQLDLAAIRLHNIATDFAKNAGEPLARIPTEPDDPTKPGDTDT